MEALLHYFPFYLSLPRVIQSGIRVCRQHDIRPCDDPHKYSGTSIDRLFLLQNDLMRFLSADGSTVRVAWFYNQTVTLRCRINVRVTGFFRKFFTPSVV